MSGEGRRMKGEWSRWESSDIDGQPARVRERERANQWSGTASRDMDGAQLGCRRERGSVNCWVVVALPMRGTNRPAARESPYPARPASLNS